MEYKDHLSDMEEWSAMWDEMQGDFEPEAPYVDEVEVGREPIGTAQDTYWAFINTKLGGDDVGQDDYDDLLQETQTPHRQQADTRGADWEDPKPVWVNEELLTEIEGLKKKMFELENKMARLGGDTKWAEKPHAPDFSKLQSEMNALRKRMDRVSNGLGMKDEPSPWKVED